MTRDDIKAFALQAIKIPPNQDWYYPFSQNQLERFAELIAAAEREAIAKKFDGPVWSYDYREIAAAIRARGE